MSRHAIGTQVPELLPEHADGTWWADIEGDVWVAYLCGWMVSRRRPFSIDTVHARPGPLYGPYRAVIEAEEEP